MPADAVVEPPVSLWSALRNIGPGIILAGSIVGSGELILTTRLGARVGFAFLWLILLSCLIKVFVQIELGRYAISSGKPTLGALNELPGPRFGAHWLCWWWFVMLLLTVSQLGGMAGLVGQAVDLAFPAVSDWLEGITARQLPAVSMALRERGSLPWAAVTCGVCVALLVSGGYRRIELVTTFLVVSVTLITVVCTLILPATGFPIPFDQVVSGLAIRLPDMPGAIAEAFAVFGITGVGASELYQYPYWCLEKGYARFAGARNDSDDWARRAKGWIRVMNLDAWASAAVFTAATLAFYFMGATVLHAQGLVPGAETMIATLSEMYKPAFGDWTIVAFLIGAWAVLFKTLYVSCASHSRLTTDFLSLAGFVPLQTAGERARSIRWFCVFFPCLACVLFVMFRDPRKMVQFGALAQAATLPIISGVAVFFRFRRTDRRLSPTKLSDICLWLAFLSISLVAFYSMYDATSKIFAAPATK
jgi:Mn2+/Fe2+ NRAMP family transporter